MHRLLWLSVWVILTSCATAPQPKPSDGGNSPALVVLDLQRDFLGPGARMPVNPQQSDEIRRVAHELVKAFQKAGRPVVYVKTVFSPKDWLMNWGRNFAAVEGGQGVEWVGPEASPDLWVEKSQSNAFTNPVLGAFLQGTDEVILVGVFADPFGCIPATGDGAQNLGLLVTVVSDGVGTSGPDRTPALQDLGRRFRLESAASVKARLGL